jgi:signal peptidase I
MEQTVEQNKTAPSPQSDETPLEALASIASVLVIGLFVLTFIFQNFVIPSGSMEKTLLIGDHVLVDRVTLAPPTRWAQAFLPYRNVKDGDIIVFYKPGQPNMFLVKRVMGVPGDRIHLVNGVVYRNGVALKEPYAATPKPGNYFPYRDDFPDVPPEPGDEVTAEWAVNMPNYIQGENLVVPPGHYFCMGDNRPESLDSRYWGFVPRRNIVGRPLFVYWSFEMPANEENKTTLGDHIAYFVHETLHFFTQTRWSRTFHVVK